MTASEQFQVDLAGLVDLLSTHLYSGPSVYVRELLQNAADAIAARQGIDDSAPRRVTITCMPGAVSFTDTGIGLSAADARTLLSTIASSSKRDAVLGGGRREYMGQFGIGLLSAFTVADEVRVVSRSARDAQLVRWTGRGDGTFTIEDGPAVSGTHDDLPEAGTRVEVIARVGSEHWVEADTVVALARDYGAYLDLDVGIAVEVPGVGLRRRRLTEAGFPWEAADLTSLQRRAALEEHCRAEFGFTPLAIIDLSAEALGLSGVAYVLPAAVAPGGGYSRVYLKRMLLGAKVTTLLPEWSFFVRAVVNADSLTPAASREQLRDDDVATAAREVLGQQIITWVLRNAGREDVAGRRFIETHHLALRAIALTNTDVRELVARVVSFETTAGPMSLADAARHGSIAYTTSVEAYRSIEAVARAQGVTVVNAGYVYDAELLAALDRLPGYATHEFDVAHLTQSMALPSAHREAETAQALAHARDLLDCDDCDVMLRTFEPADCPAVLLRDADGERNRDLRAERDASPDLWGGLLDSLTDDAPSRRTRTLALNDASPVVRALVAGGATRAPQPLFEAGLRAVYSTAVLLSGEPLRGIEVASLNGALTDLLVAGLAASNDADGSPPAASD